MRITILNCDFDESMETNGSRLLLSTLTKFGVDDVIIKNMFEEQFPSENEINLSDGIIITGSRASVYEDVTWVKKLLVMITMIDKLNIPTMGICFGYQAVTQSLGGNVKLSGTIEEGFKKISLTEDGVANTLFKGLPNVFDVYQSHGDIANIMPENSTILAKSLGGIEAYNIRNFFCVQFHPEILPKTAIKMALRDRKNIEGILGSVNEHYNATLNILSNFLDICNE